MSLGCNGHIKDNRLASGMGREHENWPKIQWYANQVSQRHTQTEDPDPVACLFQGSLSD